MNKKERAYYILEKIDKIFPEAETELVNWETPFQFLICIILSAQTTDAQVNKVTDKLFERFPDAKNLSEGSEEEVSAILKSINYYRTKARNIIKASNLILGEFSGEVPKTIAELIKIPGVGMKTANVFLNNYYRDNQGIGVDTHVMRVSQRMGLTKNKTPDKIAVDLQKIYKREDWHRVNNLFVLYGRYYCKARVNPAKSECIFKDGICSWCSAQE